MLTFRKFFLIFSTNPRYSTVFSNDFQYEDYLNSVAERINKTLKFELHNTFDYFKEAQTALNQVVFLYNNVRPHGSLLFFETPSSFKNKSTKNRRNTGQ
ncbi:integrase core domain-containing protein [Leptospira alexanderi]|uniref:integrase core domain-containing protein n=1 Tax=Leptospira alexanderi TaxID=100053 RepID=UPI003CC812A6